MHVVGEILPVLEPELLREAQSEAAAKVLTAYVGIPCSPLSHEDTLLYLR